MSAQEARKQSERLVNLMMTVHARATEVYKLTEALVDLADDDSRRLLADSFTDLAYDSLLFADKLIEAGRSLPEVGVYPQYHPESRYWSMLERLSDAQRERLDRRLRSVCLGDTDELAPRKEAALAVIEGIAEIHRVHDAMFYLSDRRDLDEYDQRLLDGMVQLSMQYVETVAVVIRKSTQIVPRG